MTHVLDTAVAADALAVELQRAERTCPVVVISTASGERGPFVDPQQVDSAVSGLCDVYVLEDGDPSRAFSRAMPAGLQVYGGASRVYGPDQHTLADRRSYPLRFAFGFDDGARVAEKLIDDALSAVRVGRQQEIVTALGTGGVAGHGVVEGVVGNRALVRLKDHGPWPAVAWPELVADDVPAERMFARGQRLTGLYDARANRIDVSANTQTARQAFSAVGRGDGVLARVTAITRRGIVIEVLPGTTVTVPAPSPGDEDDIDPQEVATVGEVLPVEVLEIRDGVPCALDILEPALAEETKPVSIFADGPPWLVPGQVLGAGAESTGPEDSRGHEHALDHLQPRDGDAQQQLLRQIETLEHELGQIRNELTQARTSSRTLRQQIRNHASDCAAAGRNEVIRVLDLFADPVEQFRHEVYVTWAARTTPDDKLKYAWREFTVLPGFLDSVQAVHGVERSKLVEVVADIACGRVDAIPGRELHQLRSGEGPADRPVIRPAGGTCWRVALQTNSPSARRLHFWRMPDRSVELSSVRLHDDFSP